jgi:hypothetical protein
MVRMSLLTRVEGVANESAGPLAEGRPELAAELAQTTLQLVYRGQAPNLARVRVAHTHMRTSYTIHHADATGPSA